MAQVTCRTATIEGREQDVVVIIMDDDTRSALNEWGRFGTANSMTNNICIPDRKNIADLLDEIDEALDELHAVDDEQENV